MARGYLRASLITYRRVAAGPRTTPLTDPRGVRLPRQICIGPVDVFSRDTDSVIFVPDSRFWDDRETDGPDAPWRQDPEAYDCFKTSFAYDLIGQEHPRIVP